MYAAMVSGNYYNIGYLHGKALRSISFQPPRPRNMDMDIARRSMKLIERHFPEILEEVKGLADASKTRFQDLFAMISTVGASSKPGCTCFAVDCSLTVDQTFLVGRNYDFYYKYSGECGTYHTKPQDGYTSIGNTDILVGREDGINEMGLTVAGAAVSSKSMQPGLTFPLIIRKLLDSCADIDEALMFITRVPHLCAFNYLIADAHNRAVVVEATTKKTFIRKMVNGKIIATNHFLTEEASQSEDVTTRPIDSDIRYQMVLNMLESNRGFIDENNTKSILSNHEGYVCEHVDSRQLGTLWSMIASPQEGFALIADGHPCVARYRKYLVKSQMTSQTTNHKYNINIKKRKV